MEALSPAALERLDYFIFALKRNGIYADLNLHVSRGYGHYHKDPAGHDGPNLDKIVDIFDPELITAQKKYASDLLQHLNAYTHLKYAEDPAVGIIEINNENSLFMWGSEKNAAEPPDCLPDRTDQAVESLAQRAVWHARTPAVCLVGR